MSRIIRRALIAALALTATTGSAWTSCAAPQPDAAPTPPPATATRPASLDGPFRVVSVTDGDTIRVAPVNSRGGVVTVRLLGIDAPETKDPRKPVQCHGPEASANLRQILAGTAVDLERGPESVDRYGRTLAYVWSGDRLINLELVAAGYAREYTYNWRSTAHTPALRAAQDAARAAGRGLWAPGGCNGATEATR